MTLEPISLRWQDRNFYCPLRDCEVLEMQAVTSRGTYWAEVRADAKGLREKRAAFKNIVIDKLSRSQWPEDGIDLQEEAAQRGIEIGECI